MEQEYGLIGGNIFHGELTPGQMFHCRPAAGYADLRTPVQGLYQAGSATHGGGGVTGIPGRNVVRQILRDQPGGGGSGVCHAGLTCHDEAGVGERGSAMSQDTSPHTSRHTEWKIEREEEPGWFGRLVAPQGGGRPAHGGGAGRAGRRWRLRRLHGAGLGEADPVRQLRDGDQSGTQTFQQSLVEPMVLGQVYALAGIALITLVSAVINRPDLALRARLAACGLAIGMLSIALSGTFGMERRIMQQWGIPFGATTGPDVTVALEPGVFCAYAAAVLPALAVWLASRPAARAARDALSPANPGEAPDPPAARAPARAVTDIEPDVDDLSRLPASGRAGSVGGLTVFASEPVDLSVTPDAWPR